MEKGDNTKKQKGGILQATQMLRTQRHPLWRGDL